MSKIKFLDSEQREQTGYSFIIDKLEVMTPFGAEEKKNIKPFRHREALIQELNNIENLTACIKYDKKIIYKIERVFCRLKDIKNTLIRCENLITLDDVELFELKNFALLMEELMEAYGHLNITINCVSFKGLKEVINILDPEGKKTGTFHIYEDYSYRLKLIRKEKRTVEACIYNEKDNENIGFLKEKRLRLAADEEEEELSIRKDLTKALNEYADLIKGDIEAVGKLDFLIAKAKLSVLYNGVKPAISDEFEIVIKDMINPQIDQILKGKHKAFVPVSISLRPGTTVITGANMGGKSVALKTTVLNLLLAQCGFFVFAKSAKLPVLDFIYFISDDMQSISQGLSTFGAEIIKLREVIEKAKREQGFIALDEFARGTNPKEGFYLVKALSRYLEGLNSISLLSTHYDNVVERNMVHYQVAGLKYVNFEELRHKINLNKLKSIDILQESMDYSLERVSECEGVPKDALNIAALLGLQDEILKEATVFYEEGLGEKNE